MKKTMKACNMLFLCILLVFTISCGNASSTTPSEKSSTARKSDNTNTFPIKDISQIISAPNKDISTNVSGIQISAIAFHCPYDNYAAPTQQRDILVYKGTQSTYDQSEITAMSKYIVSADHVELRNPPAEFRWVLGAYSKDVAQQDLTVAAGKICGTTYQITNKTSQTIQIQSVAFQMAQKAIKNTFQYQLIDKCTLLPTALMSCHLGTGGVPGPCTIYVAAITLGIANKNDIYEATPQLEGCPPLTIPPYQSRYTDVRVAGNPYIYQAIPELKVQFPTGIQTLKLTENPTVFAFMTPNNLTCYGIRGGKRVQQLFNDHRPPAEQGADPHYFCF